MSDLDQATEKKLLATDLRDLSEVIGLTESALEKGLGDENQKFANSLLASCLIERGNLMAQAILGSRGPDPRWPQLRQAALIDLQKALEIDEDQPEAQLLVGRLNTLPGGDPKLALESLNKVIASTRADTAMLAEAHTARAGLRERDGDRLADLNKAIELAPARVEAIRARGLYHLLKEKPDLAVADLQQAVELDESHSATLEALGAAYALNGQNDKALEALSRAVELSPQSPTPLTQRARLRALQGDNDGALDDLQKAIEIDPASIPALLLRARVFYQAEKPQRALQDVQHALRLQPNFLPALRLRAELLAGSGKIGDAIADLERLTEALPTNSELLLQLGMFYVANEQPRRGIKMFAAVLESDPDNILALRGRADAYLSVGRQADAIADYEAVLRRDPENGSVLNNLAWVLATSPNEALRDGIRAVELAKNACEHTEYKQGHILSTLAAAYAETGDFEKARQWSTKAVEIGESEQIDQLKAELESYRQDKPWREKQSIAEQVEENDEKAAEATQPTDGEPNTAAAETP
ncbi:MAG: tetratricopeptide repeat protein [Planctomycetales bacterium]|nr:tetratricopeptide repeat protein [Planctomycetales bacterium]